jgi:hypothetical protein
MSATVRILLLVSGHPRPARRLCGCLNAGDVPQRVRARSAWRHAWRNVCGLTLFCSSGLGDRPRRRTASAVRKPRQPVGAGTALAARGRRHPVADAWRFLPSLLENHATHIGLDESPADGEPDRNSPHAGVGRTRCLSVVAVVAAHVGDCFGHTAEFQSMSAPFVSASGGLPSQRSDTGMSRWSRRRDGCVAACLPRVRQPAMPAFARA